MAKKHNIIWLESVDSTNNEAQRRIRECDNLSVLSAMVQTQGRGQRNNSWYSACNENLLFSIVLKRPISQEKGGLHSLLAKDQFRLSEIASLSVTDFLARHGITARIKWPNDIYVGDKKICGILIENSIREKCISSSIVGIGLNINQRNFDVNLPAPTSMLLCMQDNASPCEPFDLHASLEEFMDIFTSYHDRYLSPISDTLRLRHRYIERLWRIGVPSRFIDYSLLMDGHNCARVFPGIIRGISDIGHLLVEDLTCGQTREYGFKEIGYL